MHCHDDKVSVGCKETLPQHSIDISRIWHSLHALSFASKHDTMKAVKASNNISKDALCSQTTTVLGSMYLATASLVVDAGSYET